MAQFMADNAHPYCLALAIVALRATRRQIERLKVLKLIPLDLLEFQFVIHCDRKKEGCEGNEAAVYQDGTGVRWWVVWNRRPRVRPRVGTGPYVVIESRAIRVPSLPSAFEGFKIALLSDFHLFPFTTIETIQKAVVLANSFQPDIVLLGGDFVYGTAKSIFDLTPLLTELNPKRGMFAVLGNHDHRQGSKIITQEPTKAGIEMLINRGLTLQIGWDSIYLAGLDSVSAGSPLPSAAFQGRKKDQTSLVLVHEPDIIDQLINEVPVDLQLSGHSHGGQVRLPLMGAIMLPEWGQIYNLGLYQVGKAQVYTTRGIGMIGLPIRVNCRPEVTQITLWS